MSDLAEYLKYYVEAGLKTIKTFYELGKINEDEYSYLVEQFISSDDFDEESNYILAKFYDDYTI